MNYEPIYTNLRTTTERGMVFAAIEVLIDALYKKGGDIGSLIETEMPNAVARPLKQALTQLPDTSPKAVHAYLEGLQKQLIMLRTLFLEIAFDPTEETIAVLTRWIREYLGNDIIMDLSIDRGLFGGARVSYEGRYKEINLAMLIESTIQQQEESIYAILEHTPV